MGTEAGLLPPEGARAQAHWGQADAHVAARLLALMVVALVLRES